MTASLDLLVLGNAIVDVMARTDEAFLVREGVHKGAMQLIDEARAEHLFQVMGQATIISGGSGANTAVGAALLGARAGFVGKVRDDELGRLFAHDLTATGVRFDVAPASEGPATARCFVLVTPDGERTMNTYLGACQGLSASDVDEETVRSARHVYLEGYLWDPPAAKEAFRKAAKIAHGAGNKVALTLSDAFCVDRYRDEFLGLIRDGSLDILFANIHELKSLYQTADADTALAALRQEKNLLGVVTRSERARWWSRATRRSPCRPRRCARWSTPPAQATCSRRASSPASPAASTMPIAPASARSRRRRSSRISAPGRRETSRRSPLRPG